MKYQKLNIIFGWIVFSIAAFVYLSTIEPTASFWDCGEFIATGFKLEVGHPPGAPVFMLLTRFFTLFAGGNLQHVALMVNAMSALASAFTILFLFWTITYLAKKILTKTAEITSAQIYAIIGSGVIGSLVYTFSDTFWFSAVEGEVYATSSLITAFVFWAILKWETIADEKNSDRWIILIAFVVGLSIGVHLLNLLAIPAMVLVYYFRKYTITRNGVIVSLLLSGVILGSVMWIIIPGIVKVAFYFDLLFVNVIGLPFNSGEIFFVALLATGLAWLIYYTRKKRKIVLNTIILAFTVMMIGYSSYAVIIIRSNATPPIDQNNPEDAFSLLGYLNREQYGDRPLFSGQYYNTPIDVRNNPYKEGGRTWRKGDKKYIEGKRKFSYNFNPKMTTFFPRMYSGKPEHVQEYKKWANVKGRKVKAMNNRGEMQTFNKPTFGENLTFFFRYQIGHMYWRYFMWNFAGRQNDIQGHGSALKGNWVSGINFLDEMRLGPQKDLPSTYANNKAHNKYYLLPFILGLLGLFYQLSKDKKNFWIVMALFILTGVAIVVYLNQYPLQPRERDYAFAGSFYAFAIWIGLGVICIYDLLNKYLNGKVSAITATALCLFIPAIMAAENWDDHDRSNSYIARDFAYNYLNSCQKDGVIFTNGDNDTFPLWYIQEVEGVRTDVRVICLPYLITDWYIDQMKSKYYDSEPVPFSLTKDQYISGLRDQVPVFERIKEPVELKKVIEFVVDERAESRVQTNMNEKTDYFPTKQFKITVDKEKVLSEGVVKQKDRDLIADEIKWSISSNNVMKNDMMILDLMANSDWERPIYFVSVGSGNETNMRDYFQMEGFASRFVPIYTKFDYSSIGRIDTDILYDNLMNKFRWGNMGEPDVYLNENTRRTIRIVKIRNRFGRLAAALAAEGKQDSAQAVLNRCLEILPLSKMKVDYSDSKFIESFFETGMNEKGAEIIIAMTEEAIRDMKYYRNMDKRFQGSVDREKELAMYTVQWLTNVSSTSNQPELTEKMNNYFKEIYSIYNKKL